MAVGNSTAAAMNLTAAAVTTMSVAPMASLSRMRSSQMLALHRQRILPMNSNSSVGLSISLTLIALNTQFPRYTTPQELYDSLTSALASSVKSGQLLSSIAHLARAATGTTFTQLNATIDATYSPFKIIYGPTAIPTNLPSYAPSALPTPPTVTVKSLPGRSKKVTVENITWGVLGGFFGCALLFVFVQLLDAHLAGRTGLNRNRLIGVSSSVVDDLETAGHVMVLRRASERASDRGTYLEREGD